MGKTLSPLLLEAMQDANANYLSHPYTDIFTEENLKHYNTLATAQFAKGIVRRPNHNIVFTLNSLALVEYIVDMLLKYGAPELQSQLIAMRDKGTLDAFCEKLGVATMFKVAGRDSEVSRADSVVLYTHYRTQSAVAFRKFIDSSPRAQQLFSTEAERNYYQYQVVEDLGNPKNQELPQLILRLAHDIELQRCRPDEAMRPIQKMYDSQLLQSGYTFEPLWVFAKSCIQETGGSVIGGYNDKLLYFTENPLACWEFLAAKDPYADPLYRESVQGNLNLAVIARVIRQGNAIARVVALPEIELKMLSDPRHDRPIIETTKDRTQYTDQSHDKAGNINAINRIRKPYEPIEKQPVVPSSSFNNGPVRDQEGKLLPRTISLDADRGKQHETPYCKKLATSLVHTDGRYTPYADNRLGYLYDDALLHRKDDRYVWPKNAGTITKPWLNGLFTHSISKAALQTHIRINTNDPINNELLRGLSLHAARALFYPYNSPERINLFYEYVFARGSYHNFPRLPLILWEYKPGIIHLYDTNLIGSDLVKSIENGTLAGPRLQKLCSILAVDQTSYPSPKDLAAALIKQFVAWEHPPCVEPGKKAHELLFQQIVAILQNTKSKEQLEALGFFCKTSNSIYEQPVKLNCGASHVVNFATMMHSEGECPETQCPVCKQPVTQIGMADATMDAMYSAVAELIRMRGIQEILPYTACKMRLNSDQGLFNRSDLCPPDLLALLARNLAARAIQQGNVSVLQQLISQRHLKKHLCTSSNLLYLAASHSKPMLDCLLESGANVNACDDDQGTALHYAALAGSSKAIQALLDHGAEPNALNKDKTTALQMAAQCGQVGAVDTLLRAASLQVDLVNPCGGYTAFLMAVKYGQHQVVEQLIGRANLAQVNDLGDSALHIAAEYGYEQVISVLLKHNANANYKDKSGATPMFRAAAYGREKALTLLLENNTQHMDTQNKLGDTALHMAVKFARIATVKILLANHANMELFNSDGESPLHLAIKFNRQNIVCELMQQGADYTCKNKSGETPLMLAQKNFDKTLLTCFMNEQQKREAQNATSAVCN